MPDVNSIDSLSLKITSSTEEAVKALNSLEDALLGVISATGRLGEASTNVSAFGKSLTSFSNGLKSAITQSKNLTFSNAEVEARELDKAINKLSKSTLATFGITGKKAIGDYRKAFGDVFREYQDTGDVARTFGAATKILEDNTRLADESARSYKAFSDEIDRLTSKGSKVHAAFSFDDLGSGADSTNGYRVLGRILTRDSATLDFEEWAEELAGQFKDITILGSNVSETISNIVAAYDQGKNAYMDYERALESPSAIGGLEGFSSADAVYHDLNKIVGKAEEFKASIAYGDTDNNVFRSVADAVENLNGISVGDIQGIVDSVNSVRQLDVKGVAEAAKALSQLGNSLGKVTVPEGGSNVGQFMESLFAPLKIFEGLQLPDFKPLLTLQKALSGFSGESYTIATTNLSAMIPALQDFARETNAIEFVSLGDLNETIKTITKFGHANIQKAISNMPLLSTALRELVDQLNQLPEVSDKTLRLIESISKIKSTNLGKTFQAASEGANGFGKAASKARGHTNGLLGVFMKARALLWGLRRAFDALKGSINLASDLIEVQNVVDVTFGNYQSHLEEIAKNSIETYGTSELTFKSVASQFQAMGSAMGIGNSQIREVTENLKGMGVAYGEATGQMGDMATTLTELSADMASFYNKDIEEVQTAMTSVYTGQTRPLRQFGIDLTQANLKEWALTQGVNANIETMTQAEKTMLRYQYVLAHTTAAQGDFIRTQDTWHNQTVILKEEFKALGVVIGTGLINALKPFVTAMNGVMKNVIDFAQNVVNALGQIFGWEMEITGGGLTSDYFDDIADAATTAGEGLSGGVGDAAKSAKELKDILLGIDELNVINQDTASPSGGSGGSGGGSGGSGGVGAGGAGNPISASLKRRKALYESDIKNLFDLGTYISTSLRDTLRNIDWDTVYQGAKDFGKGLASFLNGLIRPDTFGEIGGTIAKALNTVFASALAFNEEFDGANFGKALAEGLNRLFSDFDFIQLADVLTTFAGNLWDTLVGFITNVDPLAIGKGIGDFFKRLLMNILSGVFGTLSNMLKKIADWSFLPKWAKEALNATIGAIDDFVDDVDKENEELKKSTKKSAKEIEKSWDDTAGNVSASTKKSFDANIKAAHDYRQAVARESAGAKSDFEKNSKLAVTISYPNVTADAQNRLNQIKDYWNKNKKLPNLEVLYNNFNGQFKASVTDLQNWFNNHRHMGKIIVDTPQISVHSGANAVRFNTTYVPMAYASGGYPTTGELFYAGEHGIAEIAGAINGRTAVAGGAEITGIKKAVEAETAVLSSLLNRIAAINTRIADKPTEVSINGRSLNKSLDRQRSRAGYSFT